MAAKIVTHRDLEAYRKAFEAAMRILELSKSFPKEEVYSLTDQIRRSPDPFVRIWPKLGGKGDTPLHLSANYRILKVKPARHKPGWNLRSSAST
jgi:hypothetical protein